MRTPLILLIAFVLLSCSVAEPKEQEVKQVVKDWYAQQSSLDGGGTWDVSGITVLSVERDTANKKHFNTKCLATGTYHAPSLATLKPDELFSDTVLTKLEWNGAKWTTVAK
jgi:hypothetical protein